MSQYVYYSMYVYSMSHNIIFYKNVWNKTKPLQNVQEHAVSFKIDAFWLYFPVTMNQIVNNKTACIKNGTLPAINLAYFTT